jgi:two-component system response regulator NreC
MSTQGVVKRVILADGRRILREGLSAILEKQADFRVVAQADHAREAIKLVSAIETDVLVLLAGTEVRDLVQIIREAREDDGGKNVAVIVGLGSDPDASLVSQLLRAGAMACLARESTCAELIDALNHVTQGKVYLSPQLSAALVEGMVKRERAPAGKKQLAAREREILRRIADGESTKQIALALQISTKTVDTHRRRIMTKIQKRNLPELTKYAIREGLTSLDNRSSS